jgi:hypothetical protein
MIAVIKELFMDNDKLPKTEEKEIIEKIDLSIEEVIERYEELCSK